MEENIINKFDSYLRNELSTVESQQFEHLLENEPDIKTAFENHKHLLENIQQYARTETLKMIHEVEEEFLLKKNEKQPKLVKIRRFISIAAIFIIILGLGFGVNYFLSPGNQKIEIAENQTHYEEEPIFGGSPERNLIFNKKIAVIDLDSSSMAISESKREINLKIYNYSKYNSYYLFTDNTFTIFLSQVSTNDLVIKVVGLKNDENGLYLKYTQNGQWYHCEATQITKKINKLYDGKLIQKLNLIAGK